MTASAKKIEKKAELISINEISKRLRLDRATVTSRLDDLGYEPDPSSNVKLKLYLFDEEMEFAVKAAKDSLSAARIRDLRVKTQINEIKLAEARRELVPMHETVEIANRLVGIIYKEFAIHQPKRLATRLLKCKSPGEAVKLMKLDTEKFMARLRGNFQDLLK